MEELLRYLKLGSLFTPFLYHIVSFAHLTMIMSLFLVEAVDLGSLCRCNGEEVQTQKRGMSLLVKNWHYARVSRKLEQLWETSNVTCQYQVLDLARPIIRKDAWRS
ncbi:hypothetical protein VNO77_43477 [Canavalia gladiata]|uniref:Uncharacterized protein n=1 Tax=Canavalia gladiata TaxID=3824 RepID=A0AAN9PPF7_CANGL